MSYKRPNPGKREREARKRHGRGGVMSAATDWKLLKLGRKHHWRWTRRSMCVDDAESGKQKQSRSFQGS